MISPLYKKFAQIINKKLDLPDTFLFQNKCLQVYYTKSFEKEFDSLYQIKSLSLNLIEKFPAFTYKKTQIKVFIYSDPVVLAKIKKQLLI